MANIDVYSLTLPNDNNAYWLKDKSLQDAKGAANGIAELDSTGKVPSSQLPEIPSGGHTIKNSSGTSMTQRENLQFVDATISDDSTHDVTKVENVHIINSESELTNAPDGLYMGSYDDAGDAIGASDVAYSNTTSGIVSTDVQSAIDEIIAMKGANSGLAELDATGKIPSAQLPSYVDDVIEVADYSHLPITGETGKIYVTLDDNKTYRWSGSAYVEISESLALGETSSTAYAGDKGKTNADNITTIQGLIPSGATTSNKLATANDVTPKADKVTSATNGNLAGLNASGNLTDSGVSASSIGNLSGSHLGICETAASTSAKIVTIGDGTWVPKEGDIIGVKFTYSNATLFVTLNVNGTGDKSIWYGDSVDPSGADYICGKADTYIFYMYDGTYWIWLNEGQHDGNTLPSVAVYTSSNQQVKIGICDYYQLTNKSYCHFIFKYSNTYNGELRMQINNSSSAKPIYINGEISSSTNKTLPAGTYIAYYENDKWYFRTDGILPAKTTEGAEINERLDTTTTSASGNPISITGLKSNQLAVNPVITFEPIQDLHGQSNPYPAGGGRNLLSIDNVGTNSPANVTFTEYADGKITANGTSTSAAGICYRDVMSGLHNLKPGSSYKIASNGNVLFQILQYVNSSWSQLVGPMNTTQTFTISSSATNLLVRAVGNSGTVYTNAVSYPVIVKSTETDTSFSPYENICEISGYDKIEVLSCGKNLVDLPNKIMTGGGWALDLLPCKLKAGTYTFSLAFTGTANQTQVQFKAADQATVVGTVMFNLTSGQRNSASVTLSAECEYIRYYVNAAGSYTNYQIELGTTATTYEPYHKTTDLSESLGQTVYGGSLDVRTGVLTVNKAIVDLGSLTYSRDTSYSENVFYAYSTDIPIPKNDSASVVANIISEIYTAATVNNVDLATTNNTIGIIQYSTGTRVWICDSRYTNTTDLQTAVSGVKAVYELKTPIEIQLTPHEISLLKDYAYVSTNGTSIALDYHNGEIATLGDVSQLGETVNELGNYISKNESGERTDITSYTSTNRFKIPCDGYVVISSETSTSGKIYLVVGGQSTGNIAFLYMHVAGTYQMQSLFVKKGLRCYLSEKTATAGKAWFYPLV